MKKRFHKSESQIRDTKIEQFEKKIHKNETHNSQNETKKMRLREGFKKKKVVILLQPMQVDGQVITPNLFIFFMVPIHPNLQRNFFVGGGGGLGGWWVGT